MEFGEYRIVAHRGMHDMALGIPENSMKAFARAVENGVAIELDVHLTADGRLAVFHDDCLARMTGCGKILETCTLAELKALRLHGTDSVIPCLEEVLELVGGRVPLLIEVKESPFSGELERRLLEVLRAYPGKYIVESFNPLVLYWFRRHAPEICRGQLSCKDFPELRSRFKRWALRRMLMNPLTAPHFIAYKIDDVTGRFAEQCRKKNRALFAWTVEDAAALKKAARLCDGLIFEGIALEEMKLYAKNSGLSE